MRTHLLLGLIAGVTLSALPATAGIVTVQENGRTIYVDAPPAPAKDQPVTAASAYGARRIYLYYSKSEKRWMRVPPASGTTMRAARSAAADVRQYIERRQPATPFTGLGTAVRPATGDSSGPSAPSGHGLTGEQLDAIIDEAASRHGVDSNLVRAVIKVESNFNPRAVSRKGAMGLMQLMPSTARSLQITDPFDARENVDGGVRHLRQLLESFGGDVDKSVAAYNAGAGAVTRNGGIPPYAETQAYVRRVNQLYNGDPLKAAAPRSQIHVYRDKYGVLTFTNE